MASLNPSNFDALEINFKIPDFLSNKLVNAASETNNSLPICDRQIKKQRKHLENTKN